MTENVNNKDWFRVFTPAILTIVLSFIGIVISYAQMESSGGWSFLGVIALVPVAGILIALDIGIKRILKDKTLYIWIAEIIAIGLIYVLWISKFVR